MRRTFAAAALSAALLFAAACGGEDDDPNGNGNGTGDDALDTITVGVIPIVDVAPLFLGEQEGFFADRGIELETEFAAGGAEIVPGVQSGTYDFGFSNVISMMLAHSSGIDIKVVTNGNNSTGVDGEDFGSLMVPTDSPVQSADELADATIAINTLNNISDTVVRASIRNAGGDPAGVNFVGMPFPEMEAALAAGDVEAAFVVEPFQTLIRSNDVGRSIASPWVDGAPNLTVAVYFTSGDLIANDPDLVQRFTEAMEASLAFADSNPDAVRAIIPEYTSIPAEVAAEMVLPTWPPGINRASAEQLAELALEDGLLTEPPDLDALLP
jgi:NitT/TauT family transport system substrate-binding protein